MSALTDRLRGIVSGAVPRVAPDLREADASTSSPPGAPERDGRGRANPERAAAPSSCGLNEAAIERSARVLGGAVQASATGATILVERHYDGVGLHGRVRIAEIVETLRQGHEAIALLTRATSASGSHVPSPPARPSSPWFLDLETTGLAGGAGTQAFLVGCAHLSDAGILVRQFLLPGYEHEPALLADVAAWARGRGALVTFNGRSFDVPLIETRYLFHRLPFPLEDVPHTDMLHPARRLWKMRGAPEGAGASSCSLGTLERVLGSVHRLGDVPGFEIPARYFQFVRDGDARPLEAVLEHNRLDLVSLALVLARALRLIERGPSAARDGYECLGLAQLYDRAGRADEADAAYVVAIERLERVGRDPEACGEALRRLALCRRRAGRLRQAVEAWQRLADLPRCPATYRQEAREALAIFHEHRTRDFASARRHAEQMVREAARGRDREAAEHRLRRLDRKLGRREAGLWSIS